LDRVASYAPGSRGRATAAGNPRDDDHCAE